MEEIITAQEYHIMGFSYTFNTHIELLNLTHNGVFICQFKPGEGSFISACRAYLRNRKLNKI